MSDKKILSEKMHQNILYAKRVFVGIMDKVLEKKHFDVYMKDDLIFDSYENKDGMKKFSFSLFLIQKAIFLPFLKNLLVV